MSLRRGAGVIKSPSKAPVITREIDSEIEKVCGHQDSPLPPRFLLCDSSSFSKSVFLKTDKYSFNYTFISSLAVPQFQLLQTEQLKRDVNSFDFLYFLEKSLS